MSYRIYGWTLALALLTACVEKPSTHVTPQPVPAPTPAPQPSPTPTLEGYEGYTLIFNGGIATGLTSQPDGTGVAPSLTLLDREGKSLTSVISNQDTPLNKINEGQGDNCEG